MLAAHDGHAAKIGVPGDGECLVGTCGFMGVAAGKYAAKLKAVELNATFHDQGDASCLPERFIFFGLELDLPTWG